MEAVIIPNSSHSTQRDAIMCLELALNLRDDALSANECAISVEMYQEYRLGYMLHHSVSDVDRTESDIGMPDLRTLTLELQDLLGLLT